MTLGGLRRALREADRAGGAATDDIAHGHALQAHEHPHAHGDYVHRHEHGHGARAHGHGDEETPLARLDRSLGGLTLYHWLRPLVVGIVHGLAGSAAIALLVLAAVRDPAAALAYLLLFGAGTIAGMMLITCALAAPFAWSSSRLPHLNRQLRLAAGLLSCAFGLFLIYETGFTPGGLFAPPPWAPQ